MEHTIRKISVILGVFVLITACAEKTEEVSDITRLKEAANILPASELIQPNKVIEAEIASSAPTVKTFNLLSRKGKSNDAKFTVQNIVWEQGTLALTVKSGAVGTFHYETYYKCTSGFFTCQSGYTVDYRFKVKDDKDDVYFIDHIEGYPRQYSQTDENGVANIVQRKKIRLEPGIYKLIFKNIPQYSIRSMDLYESYCTTDDDTVWSDCNIKTEFFDQEHQEQADILAYFKKYDLHKVSIPFLEEMYHKYAKYNQVQTEFVSAILTRLLKTNSISQLHDFNTTYKNYSKDTAKSIEKIVSLLKMKNSIAGYEWFIENYAHSEYALEMLNIIHKNMFSNAKKLDTISAYNTFIFNYPTAAEVSQALDRSIEIDREYYTDFSFFSFTDIDKEKEKKARKLLIKAKQIERYPVDKGLKYRHKAGYFIVANRMYRVLQDEFDESDATLRHLESQEFKDFVRELNSTLSSIRSTLERIEGNTSRAADYAEEAIQVSKRGFAESSSDRALSEYHAGKHREWEKYMHLRDHGYQ